MKIGRIIRINLLCIASALVLCFGCLFAASSFFKSNLALFAGECTHTHVEHYSSNADHIEHWACCECHTAWRDENLIEVIGNTIYDRTNIDIPCTYFYDSENNKIEYGRENDVKQSITPTQYVSTIKYTGTNSNVVQFSSGGLPLSSNSTILNPETIETSLLLSESTKKTMVYWEDGHIGFQQSGAFSSYSFGSYLLFENLILKNGDDYYVIGMGGLVYADKIGYPINISGYFENKIINGFESGGNYYVDLAAKMDLTNWSLASDSVGEDWTQPGGVAYRFNKVRDGVETSFAKLDSTVSLKNGVFPDGIKELTFNFRSVPIKHLRIGLDGQKGFAKGDKIILKSGSIFTDDGNGKNAVLAKEDITFIFDGSVLTLYLGQVDVSNADGENWDQLTFRLPSLDFDLTYFYENRIEGEWASDEHAVLNKVELEFSDVKTLSKHCNNNTYGKLVYYKNNDLVGIKGDIDVTDGYMPSVGDTVSIASSSYITINAVGSFIVSNGVKFRAMSIYEDGDRYGWENVSNGTDYYEPVYDTSKSINIGAWGYMSSISNEQLSGLSDAGFNLLVGNYTIIENETQKEDLISRGASYGMNFLLRPHPDYFNDPWTPSYSTASNFLGYVIQDEPMYSDFDSISSKRDIWNNRSLQLFNKDFFVNLNPIYCDPDTLGTNDYEMYIRRFVEECELTTVSFDNYPFYQEKNWLGVWSNTKTRSEWLKNFDICSYYAKKNNIPLSYSFLTSQHYLGEKFRYINPSVDELKYQMYVGMAFGAKSLVHYLLNSTSNDYTFPIIDSDGDFTETYNKVGQANASIRSWDNVYMNHNYLGVSGIEGTRGQTGLIANNLNHSIEAGSTGLINLISSDYDVLMSHFVDGGGNKALMLTNITSPSSSLAANVNLSLTQQYKAIKIYSEDGVSIVPLNEGDVNISIPSSSAVFAVPLRMN